VLGGVVTDPTGARVIHGTVEMTSGGRVVASTAIDALGRFSVELQSGEYTVAVSASGFARAEQGGLALGAGRNLQVRFRLAVLAAAEVVEVTPEGGDGTGAGDNRSALVFEGDRLAALSDDRVTMQQQLLALAGANPMETPDVIVDGFSGGKIPPKSTIRQIRINQNPYAAQYASYGARRIEVATKPGSDQWHGGIFMYGNDSALNSLSPYAAHGLPYWSYYVEGHVSGPVNGKTSLFASLNDHQRQLNALVHAVDPVTLGVLSESVSQPNPARNGSVRVDRQLSEKNTLTARYEFDWTSQKNAGVGLLVLPSEGYTTRTTTQTLQIGETAVLSPKLVLESRFQYVRMRLQQVAVGGGPTLIVGGAFNGGGSSVGTQHDDRDRYGLEELVGWELGKHYLHTGVKYDLLRDANESTANYNGTYTFATLAGYQAGTPTQLTVTSGQASAEVMTGWLGAFAEDEWRVRKGLTLNYGLRLESQTAIPDHADWAPRAGFAWAVGQRSKQPPLAVIRGGGGLFYDRFEVGNLLTTVRQNGVLQQSFVVANPSGYPALPTVWELEMGAGAVKPTTYSVSPSLKTQMEEWAGLSVDHGFGRWGNLSVSYLLEDGIHQYLSRNVNAPLAGMFPLGTSTPAYEFAADGTLRSQGVTVNAQVRPKPWVSAWAFYTLGKTRGDAGGAGVFPSDEYNLKADFGRVDYDARHRLFAGATLKLPRQVNALFYLKAGSGSPFNITTGTDLNGDSQYNDRPTFATDLTRASVVRTPWGTFDTAPIAGQKTIPFDAGHGPGFGMLMVRASKDIAVGPRKQVAGEAGKSPTRGDAPFLLRFSVEGDNVLNQVSPGAPIGVLNSPLFGRSIALLDGSYSNGGANRVWLLSTAFEW